MANRFNNVLQRFMDEYSAAYDEVYNTQNFKHPFGAFIRRDICDQIRQNAGLDQTKYIVKGSCGAGRWTPVPWIAVFDKRITTSAQKGVYIVYLLNKDKKELYLTLNQGATDVSQDGAASKDGKLAFTGIAGSSNEKSLAKLKQNARRIRDIVGSISFNCDEQIKCGALNYDAGAVCYKKYTLDNLPNDEQLYTDLQKFVSIYSRYAEWYLNGTTKTEDAWWPSQTEYPLNLTKEDWKKFILEIELPEHPKPMKMLKAMMELSGEASCKQLADVYGGHPSVYAGCAMNLGRRVKNYFNLPACMDGNQERYFPFPFLGKYRGGSEDNYIYRIRPELFDALKEIDLSAINPYYEEKYSSEIIKFKELLEIFVRQLKINNDILPGEKVYGQGYRDMPKIQSIYKHCREFDGYILELALQAGFNSYNSSNYIHVRSAWVNIVPHFQELAGGRHDVASLQVVIKPDNKVISNYPIVSISELGLFDNQEPNEVLSKFFGDYKKEIDKYLRNKAGQYDSWEIVNEVTAIKTCDKSFFDYNGSGVPKDICWFFDAEDLATGEIRAIKIVYGGKEYTGKLVNDTTDRRRVRIFWNADLGNLFAEYKSEKSKATFVKKQTGVYEITIKGGEKEMTIKEQVLAISKYIEAKGFNYDGSLIENFYLSLKAKPFVILAGTSGTGKTRLVRLFAEAINAEYKLVSVRPDWSDSSDLFGHVDLNQKFVPGAIIDFVKQAELNPNKPYFLCLDEMNLARVEYYMSDILSAIETRRNVGGMITTDPIDVNYGNDAAAAGRYGKLILPGNLYIVGTVNMDETTFPFSKKVLDRANTIEFSHVDLLSMPSFSTAVSDKITVTNDFLASKYISLNDCNASDEQFIEKICGDLKRINNELQKANAHIGYRVRDEIVFYMLNNREADLLDARVAFDNQIMQKILPRVQGSSESIKKMLEELKKIFETEKFETSLEKVTFMIKRYEEDGFTSYWL